MSAANGNLLEEIKLGNKYLAEHPLEGKFFTDPYDEYEKLRLKVNPQNNRLVFSADVNSVFDIAWYVLTRMMSEDSTPEEIGKEDEQPEVIMICCHHCERSDCQKARNAKNQRDYRRRKAIEKARAEKNKKCHHW